MIAEPVPGTILDIVQPVRVSGRGAGLPEGNVVVQAIDRDGNVLAQQPTILDAPDAGTGGEGNWVVDLAINTEPGMAGQIRAFSPSPADNSVVAEAVVNVSFGRTAVKPTFIQITEPVQGAILDIDRAVRVSGIGGGLPEGNVVVQALDQNGGVLTQQPTILDAPDAGTGGQGPWVVDLSINVEPGTPGQIRAFSPSPADNSVLAEARVNVTYGVPEDEVPPTAVIEGPAEAFVGDIVTFQGGKSVPGSSPIVVYSWNFGNTKTFNDSPDVSASTVYDEPGDYDVSLAVRDQNDLEDTASMKITIKEREPDVEPPVAVINAPAEGVTGEPIAFDATGSQPGNGGDIVRYDWDFGNGQQANASVVENTYSSAGTYIVTLTVTDEAGESGTSTTNLNITAPEEPTPEPTLEPPPESGLEGPTWILIGAPPDVDITAQFNDGAVNGSSGCNTYSGSYTTNGNNITISGFTSSQQLCDDDIMATEQTYLLSLQSASGFQVDEEAGRLTINVAGGTLEYADSDKPVAVPQ